VSGKWTRSGPNKPRPKKGEPEHWLDLKIESARRRLEGLKRPRGNLGFPDWYTTGLQRELETELAYAIHWRSQPKE
jgi:hypothetical protein